MYEHTKKSLERCRLTPFYDEKASRMYKMDVYKSQINGWDISRGHSYYWRVNGLMPLKEAMELYHDPLGREDIRVNGHCMRPSPEEWKQWFTPEGKRIVTTDEWEKGLKIECINEKWKAEYVSSDKPEEIGGAYVEGYHVDSEAGLRILVDKIISEKIYVPTWYKG